MSTPPQRRSEKGMPVDALMQRLAPFFLQPNIRLVLLFGSAASGIQRPDSDVDLAMLADEPLDLVAETNRIMTLLQCNDVDLVDLRHASPLLMMEVARHGRLLFERNRGDYVSFCSLAHRRYVDTAKLRAAQQESIHRFLHARGVS